METGSFSFESVELGRIDEGCQELVKSAATWASLSRSTEASVGASTGVSGGVFADGVSFASDKEKER